MWSSSQQLLETLTKIWTVVNTEKFGVAEASVENALNGMTQQRMHTILLTAQEVISYRTT